MSSGCKGTWGEKQRALNKCNVLPELNGRIAAGAADNQSTEFGITHIPQSEPINANVAAAPIDPSRIEVVQTDHKSNLIGRYESGKDLSTLISLQVRTG